MLIFLLIVAAVCLVLGSVLAVGLAFRPHQVRAMRELAQRYDGKLTQRTNPMQTAVSFKLNGQPAMLRIKPPVGYAGRPLTEFRTIWPEPRLRLQIQPRKTLRPDFFYDESPTIDSGVSDFDEKYRLYAEQPAAARNLIASGVFAALDDLNRLAHPDAAYVEIHDGFLFVTLERTFGYAVHLEQLVAYCSEIRMPGITAVTSDPVTSAPQTNAAGPISSAGQVRIICNACGDVVNLDGVACDECGAIYHRRCWDPKIGCVLYSCEGQSARDVALTS